MSQQQQMPPMPMFIPVPMQYFPVFSPQMPPMYPDFNAYTMQGNSGSNGFYYENSVPCYREDIDQFDKTSQPDENAEIGNSIEEVADLAKKTTELKIEPKVEPKVEPEVLKSEPKIEPKVEIQLKIEPEAPKVESKVEQKLSKEEIVNKIMSLFEKVETKELKEIAVECSKKMALKVLAAQYKGEIESKNDIFVSTLLDESSYKVVENVSPAGKKFVVSLYANAEEPEEPEEPRENEEDENEEEEEVKHVAKRPYPFGYCVYQLKGTCDREDCKYKHIKSRNPRKDLKDLKEKWEEYVEYLKKLNAYKQVPCHFDRKCDKGKYCTFLHSNE
jgi:hypothetical protein